MFDLDKGLFNISKLNTKQRYIVAALFNTSLGYLLSVSSYELLRDYFSTILIILIANFFTISSSFLVHKLFVFNTKGNWITEYFRCYLVYGTNTIFGVCVLWILVDVYNIKYWISQGLAIILMGIFTYFSHLNFTFKVK